MFLIANAQFFHDRVPPQFVASQSAPYSNPADPTNGGNDMLAATDAQPVLDPGPARIWGFTHPALSAVELNTVTPIGVGTAMVVDDPVINPPTTDIPCDLEPKTLYASCGQTKTHRIVPVNEDGAAIDTQGVDLTFVIEDQAGFDLETGSAIQNPPVGDPSLGADDVGSEVMFTSQAANDMPGEYQFAVRDVATNSPICFGVLIVRYIPKIGDPAPAIDPLTPNQVAEGIAFIGENGVAMVGTLVADCPSKFSVCLQDGENPIRGALIFASTDQAGNDIVDAAISDQDGNAEFIGLEIGTYYVTTEINRQTVDVRIFNVES